MQRICILKKSFKIAIRYRSSEITVRSALLLAHKKSISKEMLFAVWTGLEPATPCVTGRYSNQLNYQTVAEKHFYKRFL
jgi:hypothetical protein